MALRFCYWERIYDGLVRGHSVESLPFARRMLGVMLGWDFDMSEGRSDSLTSIQKVSKDVTKYQYER